MEPRSSIRGSHEEPRKELAGRRYKTACRDLARNRSHIAESIWVTEKGVSRSDLLRGIAELRSHLDAVDELIAALARYECSRRTSGPKFHSIETTN